MILLEGCAGLALSESRSPVDWQRPADRPMTIRTLGPDHRFSEVSSAAVAEHLRATHAAGPVNILALSGGGAGGAFGAGAIAGLTRAGDRPTFDVVTGVSAGALIAPYAFLGPAWDAQLLDAFTSETGGNLLQSRGLGVIFSSSLYSGKPLQQLIDAYVSDAMIEAIAHEADRGRLLLVATTDVATGEPVVWDLGAITKNGGPSARALFRDVLLASASVPGIFPPVMIRVDGDGLAQDQAHVDGATTVPFLVPPAFLQTTLTARHTTVFVIIDGTMGEDARTTRLTAHAILSRSIRVGLNHLLSTTMELTAATAQLNGADLQYSALPSSYPLPSVFDFSARVRRPLFSYAYDCAKARRFWTAFSRSNDTGDTGEALRSAMQTQTQSVPCPADDPSLGYLATR
jgi:predicted acylesterase/phospholipase RssA